MDLKWQLSLLSMRAKRYYQRSGKKIFINANDTAGYDKSKVECFNCHKMRHFARECRAPRNKDEEQIQTNMALMAFSDSEVYNDKSCSKTCLKNYETLKKQCDNLIVKLNETKFKAATYKRGLATVEDQLVTFRKNEVLFSEEIAVLKREVGCKDYEIATARTSANGEVELTATIDGQEKTLTEASLRRHLKLEDNGGVTTLPNSEIFEQLALIGYVTDSDKLTFQKEEPVSMPHDSPLQSVHSLERAEGSMQQNELTNLVTKLTDRVAVLENDLQQTKKLYSSAFTKLILRVKKLENQVKTTKARRRARIVVSEEEDATEDSSKQGRKISNIDADPTISLVQDEGMTWFQEDAEIQEKQSDDTEILLEEEEITELVEDFGSGEKGEKEVTTTDVLNTANLPISTANATPEVSTAAGRIKTKKQSEQERLGHEEAIRLQEQIVEEERQRIARDAEIVKQLQEEINVAGQEEVVAEDDQAHDIDWSDPAILSFRSSETKKKGQEVQDNLLKDKELRSFKSFQDKQMKKPKTNELLKTKLEDDDEKEELQVYLSIVSEDEGLDVESLATKQDVLELYRLVKERFQTRSPEGYDLLLWGDLKTMIEPNEEDDIWKNQQD
ncbi:retrovirus-related pol polyprotein from transposon TNT 1-94 [Tanacetum coccineum]